MFYKLDVFLILYKKIPGQTQQQKRGGIKNNRIAADMMKGKVMATVKELKVYFFDVRICYMS